MSAAPKFNPGDRVRSRYSKAEFTVISSKPGVNHPSRATVMTHNDAGELQNHFAASLAPIGGQH